MSALNVTCQFYPNYPISLVGIQTICTSICCSGFPLTINATCCTNTTTNDIFNAEPLIIAFSVIGAFFLICFVICIVCISLSIRNASRKPPRRVNSTSNSNNESLPTIDSEAGYPPLYSELDPNNSDELPKYESVVIRQPNLMTEVMNT